MDESLISTASTLVDSYSGSINVSTDDENDYIDVGTENRHGVRSLIYRGEIAKFATGSIDVKRGKVMIISPSMSSINTSSNLSAGTTSSRLDDLRAKTWLLRKQSAQKIEESRESLRKTRTLSIEESSPPPPYPPPSVQNEVTKQRIKGKQPICVNEFSDFLRRSNSVIDRLSTEIATAGSIINENSSRPDRTADNTNAREKTNDFVSNRYSTQQENEIRKEQARSCYKPNKEHNISVHEDWCQSTISASSSPPDSPSTSVPDSRELTPKSSPASYLNASGLPPPEVVVKRKSPEASPRSTIGAIDESFLESPSTKLALKAKFEGRHLRQRPPSSVSSIGDCASMYNTKQKCEKLSLENDCLKRQLDLLESRHRDAQLELLQGRDDQELQAEQEPEILFPSTSKKKLRKQYRLFVLLFLAPFAISSLFWLYRSPSNGSCPKLVAPSAKNGIDLSSFIREGVSGQVPSEETVFSDNSGDSNYKDNYTSFSSQVPVEETVFSDNSGGSNYKDNYTSFSGQVPVEETVLSDNSGGSNYNDNYISFSSQVPLGDTVFSDNNGDSNNNDSYTSFSSQVPLGETVFSDNSGETNHEDNYTITDLDDEVDDSIVLHGPAPEYRDKQDKPSGKFANYIKRVASKMKLRQDQNFMGALLKKHEQITMKKKHSEL